jgi:hypothetical protein
VLHPFLTRPSLHLHNFVHLDILQVQSIDQYLLSSYQVPGNELDPQDIAKEEDR